MQDSIGEKPINSTMQKMTANSILGFYMKISYYPVKLWESDILMVLMNSTILPLKLQPFTSITVW